MAAELKTATVLAFDRKLDPSDALFFSGAWAAQSQETGWTPISIREKSVRGTISNRLKANQQDPAKLDAAIENPNLQTVDVATLPLDADTLKVQFTLRVLGGLGQPSACNNAAYREKLVETVSTYVENTGLKELGQRYAANLANGRFLWRNRAGAEAVSVEVAHMRDGAAGQTWHFDALAYPLHEISAPPTSAAAQSELGALITDGLLGTSHVLLRVTAFVRVGAGQEVFPSQELILERVKGGKSKTLYGVKHQGTFVAAIHSQKIGNAVRTIDTWYTGAEENGPIAIEPYGSVTTQGRAYRQPKEKTDFYNLLDNWVIKGKVPAIEQQHFVLGVLVRGGVFGDAS